MKKQMLFAFAAAFALSGGAALEAGEPARPAANTPPTKDIVDTAVSAGSFTTLVKAVQAAGLVETLKGPGPFTVFAPTDAAFAKLPAGTLASLLEDKAALTKVLTYHVVAGRVPASQVVGLAFAETVQGSAARIRVEGSTVWVDDARVVTTDIATSNGLIHVIDAVILPRPNLVETAVGAGCFGTLVTAVKAAELVEALSGKGPFTVFAPTDEAFGKLPAGAVDGLLRDKAALAKVLTYHVIPGRVLSSDLKEGTLEVKTLEGRMLTVVRTKDGSVTVNGARVAKADVLAGNGVVHVVDGVLLPR